MYILKVFIRDMHTLPKLASNSVYIGGKWLTTSKTYTVSDKATGEVIATVPDCGLEETRAAIAAAKQAFQPWAALPPKERSKYLRRMFDLHNKYKEDLAKIMTLEMGKPLREAQGEIDYGASFLEWFAEEARRIHGEIICMPVANKEGRLTREPIGVAGIITPWNFPNAMITRKVGAALAAGCTAVVKPAEDTPLSALAIGRIAEEAGLPPGVLNVLSASRSHSAEIGKEFCTSPDVATVSFTGSTNVGKLLLQQCAPQVKRVSLELGGNAPFIVFNSADVEAAVAGLVACKFRNAGQTCVSANRILVQEGIHDQLVTRLEAAMKEQLVVGPGMEPGTTVGPLINKSAMDKVERHVRDAVERGGQVVTGGSSIGGNFYQPTLIKEVPADSLVCQEETFGPLACIIKFGTEEEGLALANNTPAGLAGYFYSQDEAQIRRVERGLQVGMVGVNEGIISTAEAAFGGVKQSGIGREGSRYGIDEYTNIKYSCRRCDPPTI